MGGGAAIWLLFQTLDGNNLQLSVGVRVRTNPNLHCFKDYGNIAKIIAVFFMYLFSLLSVFWFAGTGLAEQD